MTRKIDVRFLLLAVANVAFWCMLSLQQTRAAGGGAAVAGGPTATQQRAEMIAQLKEIKAEMRFLAEWRRNGALPEPGPVQP